MSSKEIMKFPKKESIRINTRLETQDPLRGVDKTVQEIISMIIQQIAEDQ